MIIDETPRPSAKDDEAGGTVYRSGPVSEDVKTISDSEGRWRLSGIDPAKDPFNIKVIAPGHADARAWYVPGLSEPEPSPWSKDDLPVPQFLSGSGEFVVRLDRLGELKVLFDNAEAIDNDEVTVVVTRNKGGEEQTRVYGAWPDGHAGGPKDPGTYTVAPSVPKRLKSKTVEIEPGKVTEVHFDAIADLLTPDGETLAH